MENDIIEWSIGDMLEVELDRRDDFLKIMETLTRIGIASKREKKLFQSCHIFTKRGKYYIVQFKELFALDGKQTNITEMDLMRRDAIALLLSDWKLLRIVGKIDENLPRQNIMRFIKVLPFKDKKHWTLVPKYNIGKTI